MTTPGKLFCFGYGYCCEYLGADRAAAGWSIAGTTRDAQKRRAMRERGIKSFLFADDIPLEDPCLFLKDTTHLLISAPPGDEGDPAFLLHGQDILKLPALRWVGYLSSTSVYGDRAGGWVDEESEAQPGSKRGSRRLKAERQWLSLQQKYGLPAHVFRIAGIYGPGRSAIDSVRAGSASRIDKPGHAFSRIHVDDIVQILTASMENPKPGSIYNLADDLAAPSHEVISHACDLLGIAPPPLMKFDEIDLTPMTRSFYADNKRVRNDKIKQDLGIILKHPDYRAGLRACLAAEGVQQNRLSDAASGSRETAASF